MSNLAFVIDRKKLPEMYPTHMHSAKFWELLGRTISTYGHLEEILGKAIFATTATRRYEEEEIEAALIEWQPQLERALTDQLYNLAESYGKAVRSNSDATLKNVDELVEDIKKASSIRNVLCHGSWQPPDENGSTKPLFVNRQMKVFDTAVDINFLEKTRVHVVGLICAVIDSVTHMGWHFPGSGSPGKSIR